jgi:hypothetical protein
VRSLSLGVGKGAVCYVSYASLPVFVAFLSVSHVSAYSAWPSLLSAQYILDCVDLVYFSRIYTLEVSRTIII